jgi:hypothetical protein
VSPASVAGVAAVASRAGVLEIDRSNLGELPRELSNVTEAQRAYLCECVRRQPSAFVDGSVRALSLLVIDDKVVPVSVGTGTHPQEDKIGQMLMTISSEARRVLEPPALATATALGFHGLYAIWAKRPTLPTVTINDWLDGHVGKEPAGLSPEQWARLLELLDARHTRALFNVATLKSGRGAFDALGFRWLEMSDHFHFDPKTEVTKTLRSDRSAVKKSGYEVRRVTKLEPEELARVRELYRALNVGKYFGPLPQYNTAWFRLLLETGVGTIHVARKGGLIEAFSLHYDCRNSPTSPHGHLVIGYTGYDPRSEMGTSGKPRLVYNPCFERALQEGKVFSMGSGNGKFKRLRGGVSDDRWCIGVRTRGLSSVDRGLLGAVLGRRTTVPRDGRHGRFDGERARRGTASGARRRSPAPPPPSSNE